MTLAYVEGSGWHSLEEVTFYPGWEFCECADTRDELDNETGIFDPSIADWCMACDNAMPGDDPNA